ncbi:MAG: DUF3667 domain-containing protein [Ignavibacteriaceae bacterium]
MKNKINCKNCGTLLSGQFCHKCGEKILGENDLSIFSIINLSFNTLTNFDSKFFKTFVSLLLKPGELTIEFINGRRKSYMQPFQTFVLVNLFFFFFLTSTDVFRKLPKWYFEEPDIKNKVELIAKEKGISKSDLALIYDNQSASLSKSAIAVIIPFIALMLLLLNLRKKIFFGMHLVFATHFLSFLMLFMVLLSFLFSLVTVSGKYFNQVPILLAMIIYLVFSQKNFYKDGYGWSIVKSILGTALILLVILIYRDLVSWVSLYLIS